MGFTTPRTPSPPSFPRACLKPWQAVLWAAFFNVIAWAFFQLSVAATVGKGIIDPSFVDSRVIFGALVGAISWNLITWYYGIPSSSSHALIGGMIGAAVAKAGIDAAALAGHSEDRVVHLHLADARHDARRAAHAGSSRGSVFGKRRGASIGGSAACSSSPLLPTASVTVATMRRRPWASSGCC